MTCRLRPPGPRPQRRPRRAGVDGPQPPAGPRHHRPIAAWSPSPTPTSRAGCGRRRHGRTGLRRADGDARGGRARRRRHRGADDRPRAPRAGRHRARHRRSSSRSRWPPRPTRPEHRGRAARLAGVPVQVGHVERFNPAVLELGPAAPRGRLAVDRLRDHEPAGRPVPGADPRRRRDRRPRHPRCRHPVLDRRRAAGPRRTRETAQRIHADHEDLLFGLLQFPSGTVGDARRRLAHAGQASPADGRRRGGHVRARLPDPAPDVHARADVDQRRGSSAASRRRSRATWSSCRSPTPSRSRPRSTRSWTSFATGGRPIVDVEDGLWAVVIANALLEAAARAADRRAGLSPRSEPADDDTAALLGRPSCSAARSSFRRTPAGTAPTRRVTPWPGEPGTAGRSPSSAPARWACRWPRSSPSTAGTSSRSTSHPAVVAAINEGRSHVTRSRASPSSFGACPRRRAACGRRRTARQAAREADVVVLIVPVMLDDEQHPDHRYMDSAVESIAPGVHAGSLGRLRDDAAGRRHARPVRAAPRGGLGPASRTRRLLRRVLARAAVQRRGVPQPRRRTRSSSAGSARPRRTGRRRSTARVLDAEIVAMSRPRRPSSRSSPTRRTATSTSRSPTSSRATPTGSASTSRKSSRPRTASRTPTSTSPGWASAGTASRSIRISC